MENREAGGNKISVLSTTMWSESSYPTISYSNGVSPVSATELATFCWDGGNNATAGQTRELRFMRSAGSSGDRDRLVRRGRIGRTWRQHSHPPGFFTSGTGQTNSAWKYLTNVGAAVDGAGWHKVVFAYASDVDSGSQYPPERQRATSSPANAGFIALGVTSVPEPSTLFLLSTGVTALLAYGWRKRK